MVVAQVPEGRHAGPLAIFSGGSGTSGSRRLLGPVTFLLNAYDDGKSTGPIRDHLGVLGPSDPAKLLTAFCSAGGGPALPAVLASHLPADAELASLPSRLGTALVSIGLPPDTQEEVLSCVEAFGEAVGDVGGGPFEAGDLAVRNAVLVGAAQRCGGLQAGIDHLAELADGSFLAREANIFDGIAATGHHPRQPPARTRGCGGRTSERCIPRSAGCSPVTAARRWSVECLTSAG